MWTYKPEGSDCAVPYGQAVRVPGFHPGGLGLTPGAGMRLLVAYGPEMGDFWSCSRFTPVKGGVFSATVVFSWCSSC